VSAGEQEASIVRHVLAAAADGAGAPGLTSGGERWLRLFWSDRRELCGREGWQLWREVALVAARAAGAVARLVEAANGRSSDEPVSEAGLREAHRLLCALKIPCLEASDDSTAIVDDLRRTMAQAPHANPGTPPPADDHALLLRLTGEVEKGAALEFGAGCHRVLQKFCQQDARRVLHTTEGWDALGSSWLLAARTVGTFGRLLEARDGQYQWLRRSRLWLALELVGTFVPSMAGQWKPKRTIDAVRHALERKD
jgi:hypothetical protein